MIGGIDKMLRQYGTPMTLIQGEQQTQVRAFLQETRSKSIHGTQREFIPLGEVPKGIYVYIGPVEPVAAAGDLIRYRDKLLELRRAESVMVGEAAAYCWGLCVEKGGDGQWGS